jgi:hypothetical protein
MASPPAAARDARQKAPTLPIESPPSPAQRISERLHAASLLRKLPRPLDYDYEQVVDSSTSNKSGHNGLAHTKGIAVRNSKAKLCTHKFARSAKPIKRVFYVKNKVAWITNEYSTSKMVDVSGTC